MSTIKVDTNSLQTCIDNIDATKKYYAGKVSTFSGSYGAGNIGGYLSKIQSNYRGIVNNLDNVIKYISEYISDIEELEKNVDIGKSSNVSSHSLKSSGLTIVRNNIKAADLFDIGLPNSEKVYDYREAYNNLISLKDYHQKGLLGKAISLVAQAQTCVLAFKEGGLNVAENIGDGVLTVTAALCTLFGYDEGAEKLGEVIKKDLSKEWYYKRIEELGLDKYANPNSTMAQVCSSAGNFVTNIGLRVALGLIPGASAVANPLIGGLTNIGQEAEFALRQGATIGQAEVVGLAGGVIGAAVDYGADGVANFLNNSLESTLGKGLTKLGLSDAALSKIATSTGGKIFGNIGIGGIGASEGVLNLLTRTIVYEHDDSKNFSENIKSNFKNDKVALQMVMAGGIRVGVNLVSGMFKNYITKKLDATAELPKIDSGSNNKGIISFSRSKEVYKYMSESAEYFGEANYKINSEFALGKTASEILNELEGQEKIEFEEFLSTRQGRYVSQLTSKEIKSIYDYSYHSYAGINGTLRNNLPEGVKLDNSKIQSYIENIDSAIEKSNGLDDAMELYRGVDLYAFEDSIGIKIDNSDLTLEQQFNLLKNLVGETITDPAYMSTSVCYGSSFGHNLGNSNDIVLDIDAGAGTKGAYIDILSKNYLEREMLLARNTTLRIDEILPPSIDEFGNPKIFVKCSVVD